MNLCDHMFARPDEATPGYSKTQFDTLAKLNLTVRRNLKTKNYEIVSLTTGEVEFTSPGLYGISEKLRSLGDQVSLGCDPNSTLCAEGRNG